MTLGSGQIIFQEFAVLFFCGDQIFTIKSVAPISMAPLAHFQQRFYNLYHLGAMPRSEGKGGFFTRGFEGKGHRSDQNP